MVEAVEVGVIRWAEKGVVVGEDAPDLNGAVLWGGGYAQQGMVGPCKARGLWSALNG